MTGTGTKKMTDQDRRKKFEELCELANFNLEKYCEKEKKDPDDRWNEHYQNVLEYLKKNNNKPPSQKDTQNSGGWLCHQKNITRILRLVLEQKR
jgi:hypothetical protein